MEDFDAFYSRHYPLTSIGKENQLKLSYRTVLVVGMGGLGTVSSNLLTSFGVGKIKIVDFDIIEDTNLPRQSLYTMEDVGKSKVETAEKRLAARNPFVKIEAISMRIDALNVDELIPGVDLVIDGLDRFSFRRILYRAAYNKKIPYIFAGAVAESGNVMTFTQSEDKACLECVIGDIKDDENQRCEIRGVSPLILHLVAGIQVNEAIKILLDQQPDLDGVMQLIDLNALDFDKIRINKKEGCKVCGEVDDLDTGNVGDTTRGIKNLGKHGKALITSLCGRDTYIFDPKWEIDWDFSKVMEFISSQWKLGSSGKNYVTIVHGNMKINLINTGVATIRGAGSSKNAIEFMKNFFDLLEDSNTTL